MNKKLCPSILNANFSKLSEDVLMLESSGADIIHCDIMDGNFVPNITFGPLIVDAVNKVTELPIDVHLMINNPDIFIDSFAKSGADYISIHFENNYHLDRIINKIKLHNIKAGVAINPATNIENIFDVLNILDFVLIMSVNPGFGGQSFINYTLRKIESLRKQIIDNKLNCLIEVDGGITLDNIKEISDAGADIIVAGASIFKSENPQDIVKQMKKLIN